MKKVTLEDLLKVGAHFGHRTSRWNPAMEQYIFTKRDGIHVIDLNQTLSALDETVSVMQDVVKENGKVLFIGTKRQAAAPLKELAEELGLPYVSERWLGGTFTNFGQIKKQIKKLKDLEAQKASGELEQKYTKREVLMKTREIERLNTVVGGLKVLEGLPKMIFVVDVNAEQAAIKEAHLCDIPVVAICDTNVNPKGIDYVIPANDDGIASVKFLLDHVMKSVAEVKPKEPVKKESEKKEIKKSAKKSKDVVVTKKDKKVLKK